MASGTEGSAGLIGKLGMEGEYDFGSSASSGAQGGSIKNGMIFNSSGGHLGLVKMLAVAGFGLILLKILRKK